MTTNEDWALLEEAKRQKQEADLVSNRIRELSIKPIEGKFDTEHLKKVHAYIFQDLPEHQPGKTREDTDSSWSKRRLFEGSQQGYPVHYVYKNVEGKIDAVLDQFGGVDAIKGLPPEQAVTKITTLYGDLDYAHGFYEGNSRTLREFTRELASEAGFKLDWTGTAVTKEDRNQLYAARDVEVYRRLYPDLTPESAMKTNDRREYEASFVVEGLQRHLGRNSLEAIIGKGLSLESSLEHERSTPTPSPRRENPDFVGLRVATSKGFVSLVGFIESLFGMKAKPPPSRGKELGQQELALEAMESIAESIQRGDALSPSDVANLLPTQLDNLKRHGDAYMLEMIADFERYRKDEREHENERE